MSDGRHRRTFSLLILAGLLLLPAGLFAQKRKTVPKKKRVKPKVQLTLFTREARVTLGDGRAVDGKVLFRAPQKILIRHSIKGINYEKIVFINEIKALELRKWSPRFLKRNKEGEVFSFKSSEFAVVLKSGERLIKTGNFFPFMEKFLISNKHGRVYLFTFWLDLRRKDGSWYTGLPNVTTKERTVPFKEVVHKIDFSVFKENPVNPHPGKPK